MLCVVETKWYKMWRRIRYKFNVSGSTIRKGKKSKSFIRQTLSIQRVSRGTLLNAYRKAQGSVPHDIVSSGTSIIIGKVDWTPDYSTEMADHPCRNGRRCSTSGCPKNQNKSFLRTCRPRWNARIVPSLPKRPSAHIAGQISTKFCFFILCPTPRVFSFIASLPLVSVTIGGGGGGVLKDMYF